MMAILVHIWVQGYGLYNKKFIRWASKAVQAAANGLPKTDHKDPQLGSKS